MEILVTGATGFLGQSLVAALLERGDSVRALVLPTEDDSWLHARGVTVLRGDICQPASLVAPMNGTAGVFHLAAMTRVWRSLEDYRAVNVTGADNICRAAQKAGVQRIVHVSSGVVYGLGIGQPAREDLELEPIDEPYSLSKAEADLLVQRLIAEEHLPAVIVRPGTVFGPGDLLNFGRIADRLRSGKGLIIGPGNNALTFVYISDVIQGLLLAMDHPEAAGQVYNIGNDQPLTQEQSLSTIAQEINAPPPRIRVPYRALYTLAFVSEQVSNLTRNRIPPVVTRQGVKLYGTDNRLVIDKAQQEIGYAPQVDLRDGIHRTALWYQQQTQPQLSA